MSDFNLFKSAKKIRLGDVYFYKGKVGVVVRKKETTFSFMVGKKTIKIKYDKVTQLEKVTDLTYLFKIYVKARETYEAGKSIMLDKVYDRFEENLKKLDPNNSIFLKVGAPISDPEDKVKLPVPLGSLNKIKPEGGAVEKWFGKYPDRKITVSYKLDGSSILLTYTDGKLVKACTRGDGYEGKDATSKMAYANVVRSISSEGTIHIRCEAVMKVATFNAKYTNIYKNPRNMVVGVLNRKTLKQNHMKMLADVDIVAYEIMESDLSKKKQFQMLKELGFAVATFFVSTTDTSDADKLSNALKQSKEVSKYEIDGYVIDLNSPRLRKRLGFETNSINPKFARAFKIEDGDVAVTTVKHIEWNVSKHGYLKPKLNVDPVDLQGVTVSNVTAHNAIYIQEHNIGVGSEITIIRSGDVIPYVKNIVKATSADLPITCPVCDADVEWNDSNVDILCTGDNCSGSGLKKAEFFFKALGVENFSGGRIKQFWEAGYNSIDIILRMTKDDMLALDGIKRRMATKIYDGIHEAIKGCYWPDLAHASGMFGRALGSTKLEQLYNKYKGDFTTLALMDTNLLIRRIEKISGFSTKTAEMFAQGLRPFNEWFSGVSGYITVAEYEEPTMDGNKLSGQNIVFTGFRDKELNETIEKNGGKVGSSVSGNTTILVCKDPNKTSGKLDKARKAGVKLMSIDDFKTYLEDTL